MAKFPKDWNAWQTSAYMKYTPGSFTLPWPVAFDPAESMYPKYSTGSKLALNKNHFICQQCNKCINKLLMDENIATMQFAIKFYCHGEVFTFHISSSAAEASMSHDGFYDLILQLTGKLFSNPVLVNRTLELIYCMEMQPQSYKAFYKELRLLAINSLECSRLIYERTKSASPAIASVLKTVNYLA